MATLPKNPEALANIFTDPDTSVSDLFYHSINGVVVDWASALPVDADNGQKYHEYGPFSNGLKIRFYQYGGVTPLRYDFTSCTEKIGVAQSKLIGTIPVEVSDGALITSSSVVIYMDGLAAPAAPTMIGNASPSVYETLTVGGVVTTLTTDATGATFSEIADPSNKFTVAADGTVTLSATLSAASSPYSLTVRATNSGGSFDQVVTVTVLSASDLVADSTVSTAAALTSLLASWESNWAGTVPAGKTTADKRCIQLTAPLAASLTLNDYDYPQLVTIRSVGPYADGTAWPWKPTSGSDIDGTLTVTNCTNVRIWGMISKRLAWTSNTDCIYERSFYMETVTLNTPPTVAGPIVTGTRCHFLNSGGAYFKDQVLGHGACTDFDFDGVVLDFVGNDAFKGVLTGTALRMGARRMWWGRNMYLAVGAHGDPYQTHSGTLTDCTFYGNALLPGENPNAITLNGAFFTSNTAVFNNLMHEQNIYATDGQWACQLVSGSGCTTRYNSAIYANQGAVGTAQYGLTPIISGAWATNEKNIVVTKSAGTNSGEGTGGREIVIGSVQSGNIPNYTTYLATYTAVPTKTGDISALKPLVGTDAHWGHASPIGAYERSREIWVDKNVPGQVGWPLAGYWHKHWDPSNTVGTTWTGSYSADGANV